MKLILINISPIRQNGRIYEIVCPCCKIGDECTGVSEVYLDQHESEVIDVLPVSCSSTTNKTKPIRILIQRFAIPLEDSISNEFSKELNQPHPDYSVKH